MIKNLNDVLSLITLIMISIYGLGVFVNIFNKKNNSTFTLDTVNFFELLKNYTDNTEE